MYNEAMIFDNQTDTIAITSGYNGIDLTAELDECMSDTEFARKVLSYKHKTNLVQCQVIGLTTDGVKIYESFEAAAARTFLRK